MLLDKKVMFPLVMVLFFRALPLPAQSPLSINGDRIETVKGRGLLIRTRPAGARVYIDGIERGQTPLELPDLRSADYAIRVTKAGYEERELWVHVSDESRLELELELWVLAGRLLLTVNMETRAEVPARRPELFIDGSPPLEDGAFDRLRFGASGLNPGRDPVPFSGLFPGDYQGFRVRSAPSGARLAAVVPVSASRWVYDLYVPSGPRRIRVRAFGWQEAQAALVVETGKTLNLSLELTPAAFRLSAGRLSRAVFNPANIGTLGSTGLSFEVSAPGRGLFSVLDAEGRPVYSRELGPFTTWFQEVFWDGRNQRGEIQGDGLYTLRVEARPAQDPGGRDAVPNPGAPALEAPWSFSRQVTIDSSLVIYPLTLFAAMPGLFYAPSPALLPPGGLQLDFSLLFGQLPADGAAPSFTGVPLELAFRFSPLRNLELAAAFGALSAGENEIPWGAALSVKWPFAEPSARWNFALLAAFSWARDMGKSPQREGASLVVPLSWNFAGDLSLLLGPGLFWSAWERPEPRLLLSLGSMYRRGMISAGVSLRGELDIAGAAGGGPPLSLYGAAELKLNPPPSNLVFTLVGGLWNRQAGPGFFGGFALGLIF